MDRRSGFRALIVEDDELVLKLVRRVLERESFIVEGVKNGGAAIELLKTVAYDLVIIDLIMPIVSGAEVLDYLRDHQPQHLRRVIVTTASPRHMSCDFLQRICRLLEKPFDIKQLALYARECAAA